MNRWPNQTRAFEETTAAINGGAKRIAVTSPTGTGKTRMMTDMLDWAVANNMNAALVTNRRMLLEQTAGVLTNRGIDFGIIAHGHESATLRPVQLIMTQTALRRIIETPFDLILVDELHNQKGDGLQRVIEPHDAAMVGYTATPLDIGGLVDELIVAGTVSEGRACGALVPAHTYGPDEPDLHTIKKYRVGEDLSEADNRKAIMRPGVFARVFDNFQNLNPDWKPTVLFAPDVAGSIYFAEEFSRKGVRAAHIDGEKIWLDGELLESNRENRESIAEMSRSGALPVVSNRFVLREGIDWPWLSHGILACVFGSLTSYLQAAGRLLRSAPQKQSCSIQDHGGNWWRHGSVNSDREWSAGQTSTAVAAERFDRLREHKEPEPIHCPKCAAIRLSGAVCHQCGYASKSRSRVVVQVNGELREMRGDIFKPRKVKCESDTEKKWRECFWPCRNAKTRSFTFTQVLGLFKHRHGYEPPHNLPLMPLSAGDWRRCVKDVPMDQLYARTDARRSA